MTAGIHTVNLANKWLDALSNTSFASGSATLFAKLHTGDPGAAGATAASQHTTRASISWAAASGGSKANTGTPTWTIASLTAPTSETITHLSIWDASVAGNFLWSVAVTASKVIQNADVLNITTITIAHTPLAA